MGNTLATAAEWTSAQQGSRGKLEYTATNENILNRIIKFTEDFPSDYAKDAELQFKQPLTWASELKPSDFVGSDFTTT